jgi:DNA-binding beta-propeller fold protein YncE
VHADAGARDAGWGVPLATFDALDDVRAALPAPDGSIIAALGPGGVVHVAKDGTRRVIVAPWPAGGILEAVCLARMPDGRIAVVDRAGGTVAFVAEDAAVPPVRLVPRTGDARAMRPVGVAFDGTTAFVADGASPVVAVCDSSGTVVRRITLPSPADGLPPVVSDVAFAAGTLAITDAANHRITFLSPANGSVTASRGDRGAFPGMWQTPVGIASDGSAFFVTDQYNHRVVRVDSRGETLDQWGQHAVKPREGNGRIHYPVRAIHGGGDGPSHAPRVAVAEPFERRVQVFGPNDPSAAAAPRMTPLPSMDGVASHFSTELALDGRTLAVYEPESASMLVFDLRHEPPIHVTTIGGPGRTMGQFGQVSAIAVDEAANRLWAIDPVRGVIAEFALVRDGRAPRFDPFMPRAVREASLAAIARSAAAASPALPASIHPVDMVRLPGGGFVLLDRTGPRLIGIDRDLRFAWCAHGWTDGGAMGLPVQCALDAAGRLLVTDAAEPVVRAYSVSDGAFLQAWTVPGSRRLFGIASVPSGVAVTDAGRDTVYAITLGASGAATIVATGGSTGSKPGELWQPASLAWGAADARLYVADHGNHRLQCFTDRATWESSFGIGRAWVRPRDPNATAPVNPPSKLPSAEGAADTRAQFPAPVDSGDGWRTVHANSGALVVRWRWAGGAVKVRDPFGVEVEARAVDGSPVAASLRFDAVMPHHGHGMNVVPSVEEAGPGAWRVRNGLMHMPGRWELHFDLTMPDGLRTERAQDVVELP